MANLLQRPFWIPITVCGFVSVFVNAAIFRKELRKRSNQTNILYMNAISKYTPLCCMVTGIVVGLSYSIEYLPLMCRFGGALTFVSLPLHGVSMGVYQLQRLYYCTSRENVHSSIGYPKCLFLIMYSIGILIVVYGLLYPVLLCPDFFKQQCGLTGDLEYYPFNLAAESDENKTYMMGGYVLFLLWDLTTLCLFGIKIVQFRCRGKSISPQVTSRIMSILNRILLLTLFYELPVLLALIGIFVRSLIGTQCSYMWSQSCMAVNSVIVNYSIFLMQEHNNAEYARWLKAVYRYKLHYLGCCCLGRMIRDDVDASDNGDELDGRKKKNGRKESTQLETGNISDSEVLEPIPKAMLSRASTLHP